MLSARKSPRACQSCRLQLLSLFENGFASPAASGSPRARYTTSLRPRPLVLRPRYNTSIREFSRASVRAEESKQNVSGSTTAEIEAVVRQARQTFGETLPKDYLSAEEYILYERLYGPPLRETRAEDLEYLPDEEEEVDGTESRNVLLRETTDGEYEEIEFDPKLGFSVVEEDTGRVAEIETAEELDSEVILEDDIDDGSISDEGALFVTEVDVEVDEGTMAAQNNIIRMEGKNQREIDAIARLQKDMDASIARTAEPAEEEIDEEYEEELEEEEDVEENDENYEEDDIDMGSDTARTHPHTMTGRSGTFPTTISLPKERFIDPISELLERTNMKHLTEASEKAFGGPGLPYSSSTPGSKAHLPQKHIGLDASQHRMTEMEADAYLTAVMPGTYSAVMSTLVEVRKRLGTKWLRDILLRPGRQGPRVLDAGAGGASIIAWREIVQAEWNILLDEGIVEELEPPTGKTTVITGSNTLRHRVATLLDNTTFLPRLPDYIHASNSEILLDGSLPQGRKVFDIIIAPHLLFPLKENFRRKQMVQNLWSLLDHEGGVLILMEKGLPRGFEAIAGARSLLLDDYIASPGDTRTENEIESPASDHTRFSDKEEGMIIAPCTNHGQCPMYLTPGLSPGRKDYCQFTQRFLRPPFLQRVLGASSRNHEDVKFSYLAVRRGIDGRKSHPLFIQGDAATEQSFEGYEEYDLPDSNEQEDIKFHSLSLPRAILPPIKRRGHVTLDLCTPSGKLERWTIPKSFSKTAYRDARKSKWGDLWALGAKTRVVRPPRLGRGDGDEKSKKKGIRASRMGKGGKKMMMMMPTKNKNKKNKFDIIMGKEGFEGIEESRSQSKYVKREKRTKGGRIEKPKKPIGEDDL